MKLPEALLHLEGQTAINTSKNTDYITETFDKLLMKHKLKKIRFHDLWRSCATLLLNLGFSMKNTGVAWTQ